MVRARQADATLAVVVVAMVVLAGCSAFAVSGEEPPDAEISRTAEQADIGFQNATAESGLDVTGPGSGGNGAGNASVHTLDANDDGWNDLLTVGSGQPTLWVNRNGTFERSGALPSVDGPVKSATVVDFDGDGLTDIILFRPNATPVALENRGGTFARTDVGLGELTYPLGATAADFDGDGDRDLFVYQSGNWANGKPAGYLSLNQTVTDDNGNPNVLYENVGGEYRRVNDSGIEGERWSLAASFVDLTGDGRPDIHVANDYNVDMLYVNQGDGTFEARELPERTARNGMSSEVADVNGDGLPDIYVTNIELPLNPEAMGEDRYQRVKRLFSFGIHSSRTKGNNLLINQGNGTFVDVANETGLRVGGWGWAATYEDFNNDGRGDMVTATQNVVKIDPDDPEFYYPMTWEQRPNGTFDRLHGGEIGLDTQDSRGAVALDYDHDGDLELVFANQNGPFTVYDNTVDDATRSLQVAVVDASGRPVHGATVTVRAGHVNRTVFQHRPNDFLSTEPVRRHVGLGTRETATLHVTWPDGTERTFENVSAGQFVRLSRDGLTTGFEYTEGDS